MNITEPRYLRTPAMPLHLKVLAVILDDTFQTITLALFVGVILGLAIISKV